MRKSSAWIRQHPLLLVALVASALRIAVGVVTAARAGGELVSDEATYLALARQVAGGASIAWDPFTREFFDQVSSFVGPMVVLGNLFGSMALAGKLIAGSCGVATAVLTARFGIATLGLRTGLIAGLLVAVSPSQVLFSTLVLKDAMVWATLAYLACVVADTVAARADRQFLACATGLAVLLLVLGHLRPHTLVVAVWAASIALLIGRARVGLGRVAVVVLALAVVVPGMIGIGPAGISLVLNHGSLHERRMANAADAASAFVEPSAMVRHERLVNRIQAAERTLAVLRIEEPNAVLVAAGEGQLAALIASERLTAVELQQRASPETVGGAESFLTGARAFMLEPTPWSQGGGRSLQLARLETVFWYPLLALALLAAPDVWRRRTRLAFPILVGGATLAMYALSEGNVGSAYRHRGEIFWVVALLAACGARRVLAASSMRRFLRRHRSIEDHDADRVPQESGHAVGGHRPEG